MFVGVARAQDPPRGVRVIDQGDTMPSVGVALYGELEPGQTVIERTPADVTLMNFIAYRLTGVDGAGEPVTEIVTAILDPPFIDNGIATHTISFTEAGVVAYGYNLNRDLLPSETVSGEVSGPQSAGLVDNVFDSPIDDIVDQINQLELRIKSWLNNILCTAFSIIPGPTSSSFNQDCGGSPAPHTFDFDDSTGPFVFDSNRGESSLSAALGMTGAFPCANQVELDFIGNTIIPAVRGDYKVGADFHLMFTDPRNQGKRAQAEIVITGGNTINNPHGFEGLMEGFAWNPAPVTVPPIVIPGGAALSDRTEIAFGTVIGTTFTPTDTRVINSEFETAITAAPSTCDCFDSEVDGTYTETYNLDLFDNTTYRLQARTCSAGITIGVAGDFYIFRGSVPVDLSSCPDLSVACLNTIPDFIDNQRRGLRFEDISVDFFHPDLEIISVGIDDNTPLDGVISQIIVDFTNTGEAPSELIQVRLLDNGVLTGLWVFPRLEVGQTERARLAWDTTGKFGIPHNLTVEIESLTVAELDYSDNSGGVPGGVTVQPSLKAAFISAVATKSPACNDCGEVKVYDTQTLRLVGSIDIKNTFGINDPQPHRVAVPNAGTSAWVVLKNDAAKTSFALLGIDVLSCYSGNCAPLGSPMSGPGPIPTSAQGGLAVRSDGAYAFLPYSTSGLVPSVAVYPLTGSGPQTPTLQQIPFANDVLDPIVKSSVAVGLDGTMREDFYLVGAHTLTAAMRVWRWQVSDWNFGTTAPMVETYDMSIPGGGVIEPFAFAFSSEVAPGIDPIVGKKAVIIDDLRKTYTTVFTADENYSGTAPSPPVVIGEAAIATGDRIAELTASRDGLSSTSTFPTSFTTADYYWHYNPNTETAPPVSSALGCAGIAPFCYGFYSDIALSFPIARGPGASPGQEYWVVDQTSFVGGVDIYPRPLGPANLGLIVFPPPEAITIAPIPFEGKASIFPAPLPEDGPPSWPELDSNWNLVEINPIVDKVKEVVAPILNCFQQPMPHELEFPDLPPGWDATYDPNDLIDVPPFNHELENVVFVPIQLIPPSDLSTTNDFFATTLSVRAFAPGLAKQQFARLFMRVENSACPTSRDDDDSREGQVTLAGIGDTAVKTIGLGPTVDFATEVRLWIHGNAVASSGNKRAPEFTLQVNAQPNQEIVIDPVVLFDADPISFEWVSVDIPAAWLFPGANEFVLAPSVPQALAGMQIGVDTDSDADRSWWVDGVGGCPGDPLGCAGELMMLCEVCSDCEPDGVADHRQIATGLVADGDGDGLPDACAGATSAEDPPVPERRSSLLVSYPNPFNPRTTLQLHLTEAAEVTLIIYNTKGQVVRQLVGGHLPAGDHRFVWDARDDDGRVVSGGVYIARAQAGSFQAQQKLVLLK